FSQRARAEGPATSDGAPPSAKIRQFPVRPPPGGPPVEGGGRPLIQFRSDAIVVDHLSLLQAFAFPFWKHFGSVQQRLTVLLYRYSEAVIGTQEHRTRVMLEHEATLTAFLKEHPDVVIAAQGILRRSHVSPANKAAAEIVDHLNGRDFRQARH